MGYADRILVRDALNPDDYDSRELGWARMSLSSYRSFAPSAKIKLYSDHRPVRAVLEVPIFATGRRLQRAKYYGDINKAPKNKQLN